MAHALDFIPQIARTGAAPRPVRDTRRQLFGLPVCDYSWDQALDHAHMLIGRRGTLSVLSFLDPAKARRARADARYADALARHVLLPSGRGLDVAARMLTGSALPADLPAVAFVPALLTFVAEPLRIGVMGDDAVARQALVTRLAAHAPWHRYVALSMDEVAASGASVAHPAFDLLILAADGPEDTLAVDRRLRAEHAALVIVAGPMTALLSSAGGSVASPRAADQLAFPFDLCREWLRTFRKH